MTAADTSLELIQGLDFDAELPCEHPVHEIGHADEPGAFLVNASCPKCPVDQDYVICEDGWARLGDAEVWCPECDWMGQRDEAMRIIRKVKE